MGDGGESESENMASMEEVRALRLRLADSEATAAQRTALGEGGTVGGEIGEKGMERRMAWACLFRAGCGCGRRGGVCWERLQLAVAVVVVVYCQWQWR